MTRDLRLKGGWWLSQICSRLQVRAANLCSRRQMREKWTEIGVCASVDKPNMVFSTVALWLYLIKSQVDQAWSSSFTLLPFSLRHNFRVLKKMCYSQSLICLAVLVLLEVQLQFLET